MAFFKPRYKYGEITKGWGDKSIKKEFDVKIDDWLNQFNKSERSLLLNLLCNFYYYSETRLNEKVKTLHSNFISEFPEESKIAIYSKIQKVSRVGFSDIVFTSYWKGNALKDHSTPDAYYLLENDQVPPVLIIIDDYLGSGDTFLTQIKKMIRINNKITKSKVFFLTIHGTEMGFKNIDKFATEKEMEIKVIALDISFKAFKGDYIFTNLESEIKKSNFEQICNNHNLIEEIWGFADSQSLVAFEYNSPNNTMPIFWRNLENYTALFKRHQKTTTNLSEMRDIASKNKNNRGQKPLIYGIDHPELSSMIIYCVINGKNLSINAACKKLGLTPEQFEEKLRIIIDKKYVQIVEGKILPTKEFQEHLVLSRIKELKTPLPSEKKIEPDSSNEYIPIGFGNKFSGY